MTFTFNRITLYQCIIITDHIIKNMPLINIIQEPCALNKSHFNFDTLQSLCDVTIPIGESTFFNMSQRLTAFKHSEDNLSLIEKLHRFEKREFAILQLVYLGTRYLVIGYCRRKIYITNVCISSFNNKTSRLSAP